VLALRRPTVFDGDVLRLDVAGLAQALAKCCRLALAEPMIKARFAELGGIAIGGLSTEFGKFIADETEKWGKVVKFANIRAE